MARLYSYVVQHDHGFAPNPVDGICTLARCKFANPAKNWKNIVELAQKGDWVVGTGGTSDLSSGHGTLLYAMRVDHVLTLAEYIAAHPGRIDAKFDTPEEVDGRKCLLSEHFFYFGRNAIPVSTVPMELCPAHPFEKKGPGWRSAFSPEFVDGFSEWIARSYLAGTHGRPCKPLDQGVDESDFENRVRRCADVE